MTTESPLVPVILCGGAGSRLWPVSRRLHPKPFIELADGESLLQKAFLRGANLPDVRDVLVVTNREYLFQTRDACQAVADAAPAALVSHFMVEPEPRNTAAAIAAASEWVARHHGPGAQLLVLPADHLIDDWAAFVTAVHRARRIARNHRLVTFGIRPTHAETGYGYIEHEGDDVVAFVEKPDLELAEQYCSQGRHLWNSGMFCFAADDMLAELAACAPRILSGARAAVVEGQVLEGDRFTQIELSADRFAEIPADSIDYAVMEHTRRASVVSCDIGWSDIGSWEALGRLTEADEEGNRIEGEVVLKDTFDCYIRSDRLVGTVGLRDLIIVDTPDALLVANRHQAQDVKRIYSDLQEQGHELHEIHRTVHRPWGTYTVLEEGSHFKIKRLVVRPGGRLSLQLHHHRSEHWVVVSGTAEVENDGRTSLLGTNESTYISAGHRHRVGNPGLVDLVMIEVQTGEYLGEDDIVRFDDVYGRS
jgi:mannose-1-phosphate guanylyltransferase